MESRDLNLPAALIWSFHLQPGALGADKVSRITDASCWILFHLRGVTPKRCSKAFIYSQRACWCRAQTTERDQASVQEAL